MKTFLLSLLYLMALLVGCKGTLVDDTGDSGASSYSQEQLAEMCGKNLQVIQREEWGAQLLTQNSDVIDTTDMQSMIDGVASGVYPPHPIWPSTDDFGAAYDFGEKLCTQYGICWGWDTLDWLAADNGPLDTTVIHHTAARLDSCDEYLVYVANLHTYTNGWGDIGYNMLACVDNTGSHVYEGRWSGVNDSTGYDWTGLQIQGAHAYPNTGRVGLGLVGDFTATAPSDEELELLMQLVARATYETGLSAETIVGHDDLEATICPGTINLSALQERVDMCREAGF